MNSLECIMKKYLPCDYPSISGIIANISKGRKWNDVTHVPGICVAYSYCVGGYGIVGKVEDYSDEEIKAFFDSIFSELLSEGEEWFEFSSEDILIYDKLLRIYSDKEIYSEIEYSFRANGKIEELMDIPKEITICQVDKNLIKQMRNKMLTNSEMFFERFDNSWNDEEDFLSNSGAFVAICSGRIVGIIFGSSSYEKVIVIDIEVEEDYRNKNIAKRLSQEMLNHIVDRNYVLQWDCTESNVISKNLAQALGLIQIKERPYYWFKI